MAADDILFAPIGGKSDIIIPESWLWVINQIKAQSGWECSALAGGALRDLDNGRPIKDVDIFVPWSGDNNTAYAKIALAGGAIADLVEIEHNPHSTSQVGADGISHFHFTKDGWKFEISQKVEQFNHLTLLDSFDIGLCMISLDDNNKIYRAPEYKADVSNKSITVVRETGGREEEHAERISRKYPRWTIVLL